MPSSLILYFDSQLQADIKTEQQNVEHCQDLLNLCCQWWQESRPAPAGEFNYYIPFYVKIYKQEITNIIL